MAVNPDVYPSVYHISHVDSNDSEVINEIDFSRDMAYLLINENLSFAAPPDSSNAVAAFNPSLKNNYYGGALYMVSAGNPNVQTTAEWHTYYANTRTLNIRWFLKVRDSLSEAHGREICRWTNQINPFTSVSPIYSSSYQQTWNSMMTNTTQSFTVGAVFSPFYDMHPITKIDLDKIILRPVFIVKRYEPRYNNNGDITSFASTSSSYYWDQIKPEDNTPAGVNYNQDLWESGFYDEMNTQDPSRVKYRYILTNAWVQQYYDSGLPSNSTQLSKNVSVSAWDADGNANLPGSGTQVAYLMPMMESEFSVDGKNGVMLQGISGLIFSGQNAEYPTADSNNVAYVCRTTQNGYYQNVYGQGTTMQPPANNQGGGFALNYNDNERAQSFTSICVAGGEFANGAANKGEGTTTYHLGANGEIFEDGTQRIGMIVAPFSLKGLWSSLASLGVYVVGYNTVPSGDFELGVDFPTWLYRGEITGSGITNGVMKQGEDAAPLPPWREIDFNPTPPSPGGDEESGDTVPNQYRYFSGATNFITQYALTASQLQTFGYKLWTSWADSGGTLTDMWKNFWILLGLGTSDTGSVDIASVMSFIVSCRVYPFNLIGTGINTFVLEDNIKIGTGAYPIDVSQVARLGSTVCYVDCGTVFIPKPFEDFRDYTNMEITCFCPYCGTVELNPADVVGRTIHARYAVDLQSGDCLCLLTIVNGNSEIYNVGSISGSIGALIPLSATNSGQVTAQKISDIAGSAGLIGNFTLGNLSRGSSLGGRFMSGGDSNKAIAAIASGIYGTMSDTLKFATDSANMVAERLSRAAISCPTLNGGSGLTAFTHAASPYIQMRYAIYPTINNYPHTVGMTSTRSSSLSEYEGKGFTKCENVDVSGLTCNEDERNEIKALLESGVYL